MASNVFRNRFATGHIEASVRGRLTANGITVPSSRTLTKGNTYVEF